MMNKKIFLLLVSVFCLGSVVKSAYASHLDFELGCPGTVKAGKPLNVTVKNIENWDGQHSVVLKRYMAGIVANKSNTVGDGAVYGPFAKNLATAITVPPATYSPTFSPGTVPNFSVPVVPTTPNIPGKMALVFLQFITSDGNEMESGDCKVNIIP